MNENMHVISGQQYMPALASGYEWSVKPHSDTFNGGVKVEIISLTSFNSVATRYVDIEMPFDAATVRENIILIGRQMVDGSVPWNKEFRDALNSALVGIFPPTD